MGFTALRTLGSRIPVILGRAHYGVRATTVRTFTSSLITGKSNEEPVGIAYPGEMYRSPDEQGTRVLVTGAGGQVRGDYLPLLVSRHSMGTCMFG